LKSRGSSVVERIIGNDVSQHFHNILWSYISLL